MYKKLVQEVRENLANRGWRLFLYPSMSKLKRYNCTGICNEDDKILQIATKRLAQYEILWFLAHEYAHFKQLEDYKTYPQKNIERAFESYTSFVDYNIPITIPKWKEAREIVIEYEFDAEKRAYKWLKDRGVKLDEFCKSANSYSYVIRYALEDGIFLSSGRSRLFKEFNIPDRWFSKKERQRKLRKSEIAFMRRIAKENGAL